MLRKGISSLLLGALAAQHVNALTVGPVNLGFTTVVGGITSVILGGTTSVTGGVTSVVGGVTNVVNGVTSVAGGVTTVVGGVTSIVGGVTSVVGGVTSVINGGVTIPTIIVVPTTISTDVIITVTTVISSSTTDITTVTQTNVVTEVSSTSFIVQTTSAAGTTITDGPIIATSTPTSSSTTFENAPQYTGNPFHIESNFGTLGTLAAEAGSTRLEIRFGLRDEVTLNGFGNIKSFGGMNIWYTLTAGSNEVFSGPPPASILGKRQTNQQALTCQVARTGVLFCNGAAGNVFYTDGTTLYLGAAVPAGFFPVTLIAVLDNLGTTTPGATGTATALPTGAITQAPYWGNWGYGGVPSGVPVALTTCITLPGPSGYTTKTVTVTSLHCGCTETPIPTAIVMTTSVTTCPDSWGYTTPVTVTVPVTPTTAAWQTWDGVVPTTVPTSAPKPSSTTYKPYTGAASAAGVSSIALGLAVAIFAIFA